MIPVGHFGKFDVVHKGKKEKKKRQEKRRLTEEALLTAQHCISFFYFAHKDTVRNISGNTSDYKCALVKDCQGSPEWRLFEQEINGN